MLIDLTLPLHPGTVVFPGDPVVEVVPVAMVELDGFSVHALHLGSHSGTHIDAPAHFIEGGKTLDRFPLSRFVGRGRLLDLRQDGAPDLQGVGHGDIVLLRTGFEEGVTTCLPSLELAEDLVRLQVSMVAVDAPSIDESPFPVHRLLLGADVLVAENLIGLRSLEGRAFDVVAFPLPLQVDGAPARIVAQLG
jgi:arylformamidase